MKRSVRQPWVFAIAAALLLLAAMAPTLSRLIQHALPQSAIMAAVCSTPGSAHAGSPADAGTEAGQCQMCLLQAPGLMPHPQVEPVATLPALSDAMPSLFLWAPRPLFAWAAAQPRAPPHAA